MAADRARVSLKLLFAMTTLFCIASAISSVVSVSLLAIMAAMLGLTAYHELEHAESATKRWMGVASYILGMILCGCLLYLVTPK